jgi:hypothetical protein
MPARGAHIPSPVIRRKDKTVSDVLPIAEAIARRAGAILREGFGNVRQVRQKGAIDLVTEFDQRCEEAIVSALQRDPAGGHTYTFHIALLRRSCQARRQHRAGDSHNE